MGLNLGGGIEFGEYYQFRKDAENEHRISDENNLLFILFYGNLKIESNEFLVKNNFISLGLGYTF